MFKGLDGSKVVVPILLTTEIGLFSQQNSEKLYLFGWISDNRNIVRHVYLTF